jgi:hypothetical protein
LPPEIPKSEVAAAIAELDNVRKEWLKRPGVTAVDVGLRFKNGRMTDQLAIRVHVRKKVPPEDLCECELFPERLGRFMVDIIEAEYGPQSASDALGGTRDEGR